MQTVRIEAILDEKSFFELSHVWNSLAEQMDSGSVFLRHEWFDAAWRWLREDSELLVLTVLREVEIIGICPLVRRSAKRPPFRVTAVEFLAVPDTQECNILASEQNLPDVIAAVAGWLASDKLAWDVFYVEKIRSDNRAAKLLRDAMAGNGYNVSAVENGTNPGIILTDDWAAYYGRRSRRLKKGNNHMANRLTRAGKRIEISRYDSSNLHRDDLESLLAILIDLSRSSWKAGTGLTLDNPGPGAFILRLSEHAIAESWLLVWVLSIDGEPAAMEFQLQYGAIVYGLRADYDQAQDQWSPGALLNWRIIENLFESGAAYYSLGPGSNTYKMRWAEADMSLVAIEAYGKTVRGRLLGILDTGIRPLLKKMRGFLKHSKRIKQMGFGRDVPL